MTTAREMMHLGAECVPINETLERAAQIMRDKQVGSLPICGDDNKLKGILTDRDIVVKCIAAGQNPAKMTAGGLAQGKPIYVDADDDANAVLKLMEKNKIRRVPVIENHKIIGMISEADLAQHLDEQKLAHFVSAITKAPPTKVTSKAPSRASSKA